ncbi:MULTISPECIES: trigger factor [Dehalobacter]|uniref:Trigger factor n=2 Tax=Dehalobacter restrictus TaxID=55583 RepID=A0A857DJN7_9FIRM|nr:MULTISPECIES: trigger factor [Dehalobacter]AHF10854.1 trigger factor [Dehalobacter restrictus DSM 9455]OCZ52177.1 trigger factor [Dehalobacter sp. TeCB1]QHA01504.1 trigger factor [Dehalobacter restrictus]
MSVKIEKKNNNIYEMEITVGVEEVSAAFDRVMKRAGQGLSIPGFRKGKAPKHIIERYVDKDAVKNEVMEQVSYPALFEAYKEHSITPVSRPAMQVVQFEADKDLIFKVTVETKPDVELGQYKSLGIERQAVEVTDEQVAEELERRQNRHAKLIPVEDGEIIDQDIVTIDFEGFLGDVPFEGGKGENHELTIGSGTFIPGFEEQLKGAKSGQELEISVKFPEGYHSEELSEKDAMFKVKINGIKRKELAALDDEFAKDVSEFDTLEELKQDIREKMISAAEARRDNEYKTEVIKKVAENAVCEIPEGMKQERIDALMEDLQQNMSYQGISMEQYCQYVNTSREALRESFSQQATDGLKTELVLEAIAEKEGITVTDEEIESEINRMAMQYGRTAEELKSALEARGEMQMFKMSLTSEHTVDFLVKNNGAGQESAAAQNTDSESNVTEENE